MNRYLKLLQPFIAVLATTIALTGCATRTFPTPEVIGNQGLVVGQILTVDYMPGIETPVINGKEYGTSVSRGYILLALNPGQYTLEKFVGTGPSDRPNQYIIYSYPYPMQRNFTIEAGKVTNLGLLLIQSRNTGADQANTNRYNIFLADNSREMTSFLKEVRPKLYDSLKQKNPVLAPGNYFNGEQVNSLRSYIASKKIQSTDWKRDYGNSTYVTGPAGTLATLTRNTSGAITTYKVLETNSLADLSDCNSKMKVAACLISSTEYIMVKNDQVTRHALPPGLVANSLLALNDNWLVMVDNSVNVYSSLDNGQTWRKFDKAAVPQPIKAIFEYDSRDRFGFFMGKDGYYIFLKANYYLDASSPEHKLMVYGDYRTATLRKLNLPKPISEISKLHETDLGIYLGSYGGFTSSDIYFLPKGKENWETRELHQTGCHTPTAFPDNSGNRLQVLCWDSLVSGKYTAWESNNGGLKWSEIPQANSLFKK